MKIMNTIEDTELRRIISLLDEGIPKDGAQLKLEQYGGGPDEGMMIGNKTGYLRFGVEFLKAAFAEQKTDKDGKKTEIDVEVDYIISSDSDMRFDWFQRSEELDVTKSTSSWSDRIMPVVMMIVIVAILGLSLIGVITVLKWLF